MLDKNALLLLVIGVPKITTEFARFPENNKSNEFQDDIEDSMQEIMEAAIATGEIVEPGVCA